jgi:signal transduction histidine kinase
VESGAFVLQIADNGVGITRAQQSAAGAIGLLGMHERAALIGATTTITGRAGRGTEVTVRLPLPPADTPS